MNLIYQGLKTERLDLSQMMLLNLHKERKRKNFMMQYWNDLLMEEVQMGSYGIWKIICTALLAVERF